MKNNKHLRNTVFFTIKIVSYTCFSFIIFSNLNSAWAATYYVSPNGSAAWPSCTTISNPCRASNSNKSFLNASAGDTVYFLDGTYSGLTYNDAQDEIPSFNPANSGTSGNPITFKSLNKHGAHLIGYNTWGTPRVPVIGAYQKNYIVWDGFIVSAVDTGGVPNMGTAYIYGSNYITVKNCDLRGAPHSTGGATNYEGVRIEWSNYILVERNLIHGYIETSNNHNTSGTKQYWSTNVTFRNNEIYNNTAGIYVKRDNDITIFENNYVHDNYIGEYTSGNGVSSHVIQHVNNVFAKNITRQVYIVGDSESVDMDGVTFINNTFLRTSSSSYAAIELVGNDVVGEAAILFNNIFYGFLTPIITQRNYTSIKECDHNNLGNFSSIILHQYDSNAISYTGLSAWQSSRALVGGTNPGLGSIASNPLFINTSRNYSQLSDFALANNSPCIGSGRNGLNMGADISRVGVFSNGILPPDIPETKPSTPEGFIFSK